MASSLRFTNRELVMELHRTCAEGDTHALDDVLSACFAAGDDPVHLLSQTTNAGGSIALMRAAHGGHIAVVQKLLGLLGQSRKEGNNNNNNIVNQRDDTYGTTSLMLACAGGHHEVVEMLLAQPCINMQAADREGRTALLYAARKGHLHCCQALLLRHSHSTTESSSSFVNQGDETGLSPLQAASLNNHVEVVELLLDQGGACVDQVDVTGSTALMGAAFKAHVNIVSCLLRAGASTSRVDGEGLNAQAWVQEGGRGNNTILAQMLDSSHDRT
eukprot:CAMPEP_0194162372 /NCGR_PEP_ID=MMETSP0152-20130528/79462_1 /TAXON_ID=1049557 /ORGANISM="Thalassiothrix antarctica, Strain L6-D1" /LENGTH=272 /DNA_ID=CAMNT_0038872269 /DNA_START=159 /DNA_END=974 /DNA_ORIENTATION=+